MAIGQQVPPAADENNKSKATCQTPHIPRMMWTAPTRGLLGVERAKRVKEKARKLPRETRGAPR